MRKVQWVHFLRRIALYKKICIIIVIIMIIIIIISNSSGIMHPL